MEQKKLIGIMAILIIIAVIVAVSLSNKSKPEQEETKESGQEVKKEATPESVDELMKSLIEEFKTTCATFLAGELSGDPDADCPGFENPLIKNQCYYCFATKNQNPALCGKIDDDPGFKAVCQRATGSSIDEIINQ